MKWGWQNALNQQTWSHRRLKLCLKHPDPVITQEEEGLSDNHSCSLQSFLLRAAANRSSAVEKECQNRRFALLY